MIEGKHQLLFKANLYNFQVIGGEGKQLTSLQNPSIEQMTFAAKVSEKKFQ